MTRAVTTVRIINNKSSVPPLTLNLKQTAPIYRTALAAGQLALVGSGGAGGYTYSSATGLPAGLTLNTATGAITGTPTTIGHYVIAATVTDSATNTYTTTFSIDVLTRLIGSTTVADVSERTVAYSYQFIASGGTGSLAWAVSSGTLPYGLSLSSSGVLSGTPTTPGAYSFVITVTDSGSGDILAVTATHQCVDYLTPVGGAIPSGPIGFEVSTRLTNISTTGGFFNPSIYTVTWSVTSSPSVGVDIAIEPIIGSYDATLKITPSVAGSFSFSLTAKDSLGVTVTNPISIANYFVSNAQIQPQKSAVNVGPAGPGKINFNFPATGVPDVANDGTTMTVTIPTVAGPTGPQGATGPAGATGATGPQGPQGAAGASRMPIVTGETPPVFVYADDGSLITGDF